jgi:hypothetical protein
MDRKELYAAIKADDELLAKARAAAMNRGINWTSLSNENLQQIVDLSKNSKYIEAKPKTNTVPTDRKGLYEYIKANKLQDLIKAKYGKNFTQVSTEQLIETCKDFGKPTKQPLEIDEDCLKKVVKKDNLSSSSDCIDSAARNVLKALCITVNRRDLLNQLN